MDDVEAFKQKAIVPDNEFNDLVRKITQLEDYAVSFDFEGRK